MNILVPFTKDIKFNCSIAEILSISLEHDYTINEGEILGNFTITGDYKSHEVSVNKEHFEYVLPFSVNISDKIDLNTIEFEVNDFTYDILNDDTLRVDIEYRVSAKECEPLFRTIDEPDFDKILEESEKINQAESNEVINREIDEDDKNVILENVTTDTEYITYIIHEMKETDNIDTICTKYNISKTSLNDYNDLTNIGVKGKLIIPIENE